MNSSSASHGALPHPNYRPDIDGLRAFAVLAVVAYHAFPGRLPGGFVGVDVFFVISGFLISSILFQGLEDGSFSFVEFYVRRIRRIFPALALVLACALGFGWFAMLADEYRMLGKHVTFGAGFLANFLNWSEAGYFDKTADVKPLLHLWSLGIEEQFYILWPVLLWAGWKRNWNLATLAAGLFLLSFALNMKGVRVDPVATFYSPQTRFWELLAGALLAWFTLHPGPRLKQWLAGAEARLSALLYRDAAQVQGSLATSASILGMALLVFAVFRLTRDSVFPGGWALVPVLGAVLLIAAGPQAVVNRWLLSNRVAVWFGSISYPLYLWHYPLLSFPRILAGDTPPPMVRAAAVAAAIVLAWLTCILVERRLRFGGVSRIKAVALLVAMVLIAGAGYAVHFQDGVKSRRAVLLNPAADSGKDGGDGGFVIEQCGLSAEDQVLFHNCSRDKREEPSYALIGDSKADVISGGLYRTSLPGGRWMFIGGNGKYGPAIPAISPDPYYAPFQHLTTLAAKTIAEEKSVKTVAIVGAARSLFGLHNDRTIEDLPASPHYRVALDGLNRTVETFINAGKKVVIVIDNPTLPPPEDCLNRKTAIELLNHFMPNMKPECIMTVPRYMELARQYRTMLEEIRARHPQEVRLFDTLPYMCDMDREECRSYKNGRLLYVYTDHMSEYAAGMVGKDLNQMLQGWQ